MVEHRASPKQFSLGILMALIACKECGAQVSSTATSCPKCGAKLPRKSVWPWLLGIPSLLLAMLLAIGSFVPEYEREAGELRDICKNLIGLDRSRLYECEKLYNDKVAEGREREAVKRGLRQPRPALADIPLTPDNQKRADCANGIESTKSEYRKLIANGEYVKAADLMRPCAEALQDPFLQKMVSDAELKVRKTKRHS